MATEPASADYARLASKLKHFAETTNKLFYYSLERCSVSTNGSGNLEVGYRAYDENAKRRAIFIIFNRGKLEYRNFEGFVAGTDRHGKRIEGRKSELDPIYHAAVSLLVQEMVAWAEPFGIMINRLEFDPSEFYRNVLLERYVMQNGEWKISMGKHPVAERD